MEYFWIFYPQQFIISMRCIHNSFSWELYNGWKLINILVKKLIFEIFYVSLFIVFSLFRRSKFHYVSLVNFIYNFIKTFSKIFIIVFHFQHCFNLQSPKNFPWLFLSSYITLIFTHAFFSIRLFLFAFFFLHLIPFYHIFDSFILLFFFDKSSCSAKKIFFYISIPWSILYVIHSTVRLF